MSGCTIIVEGVIGAGKTTFSKELAHAINGEWLREPDEENGNPYLQLFYNDPKRWAFTMQMHLLNTRYRMHMHAQWYTLQQKKNIVLDRSYFGDTAFAKLQIKGGTMTEAEFDTYAMSYQNMTSSVLLPQVCVYLDIEPSVAQDRVNKRMEIQTGRKCEKSIDLSYLENLKVEEEEVIENLQKSGVYIIKLDWNDEKSATDIKEAAKQVADKIASYRPNNMFSNCYARIM